MKKISAVLFLFIVLSLAGRAQKIYSSQNLERATQEQLKLYFGKAAKLKKTGAILTIAGPASFLTGTLIAGFSYMGGTEASYKFGIGMVFAGMGATAAGIPILITGSSRVKKVRRAMAEYKGVAIMDLVPCSLYNFQTNKSMSGIMFRIRF